ncbi:zinc ribbon domain-containing protein [Flavobacterium sp.]|uniref:zinc ribbon domain-containing protein n=1 Tax=Flavobacterium sp. TaxID=239 RepID=UPI00404877C7
MKVICSNCEAENQETSKYCSVCGYKISTITNNKEVEETKVEKPKKGKRKLDLKTILGFVLGFFAMFYLTQYFFKPSMNIDTEIENSVNELNENCPMRVDDYMTLDSVVALPNRTIQYNYSLVDIEKSEVNLDTVKKYVFSAVLANIKTNPDMKVLIDNKLTFNHYYKDKKGAFVTKYVVTPKMYTND